jgi:hypothetical protein
METMSLKLPIRLVPRKGKSLYMLFFMIFWTGFSVFWVVMASSMLWGDAPVEGAGWGFKYLFPAFGIPFVVIGVLGLSKAVLQLLPSSPAFHVEIAADGILVRAGWKVRRFDWASLSAFDVALKVIQDEGTKTKTYWIVALRAEDAQYLADEKERYRCSVLKINAGEYGSDGDGMAASELAEWLNQLRQDAIDRRLKPGQEIAIPPAFRSSVIAGAPGAPVRSTPAVAAPHSVIER